VTERLPASVPGMRIGLYGGSFNPAHAAHRMVAERALKRLGLDRVWLLVTPGNPLKETNGLRPLAERIAIVGRVMRDPRIVPTGIEATLGTHFTIDSLKALKARCPGVRFVWIMGGDNLRDFSRWRDWRGIARQMPIAVIDRPGTTHSAVRSNAAQWLRPYRIEESDAAMLADLKPPSWVFLHGPRSDLSSTAVRQGASPEPA
jgi:nicotinate-nucleotide adenylyltransferase